ncbi:hypothetical protein [Pedobacter sp.]|uniref:hypothetical protein n=1 Tax=Pedobacter sp. TaxID=1411316 RepID=UPI003D7FCF2F
MDVLHKLETALAVQYDKLPHFPVGFRTWLAQNAWWIVLVAVIFSVLGVIGVFGLLAVALLGVNMGLVAVDVPYDSTIGAAVSGVFIVLTILSLLELIIQTVLLALAISPLRKLLKRGWDLLFLVLVINTVLIIVGDIISVNIPGLIVGLLLAVIGGYFLFELRDQFGTPTASDNPVSSSPMKEDPVSELPT